MKRELDAIHRFHSDCCPGHDDYPNDTYSSNRSKRARAKGKTKEHKYVRTLVKRATSKEVKEILEHDNTDKNIIRFTSLRHFD